MRITQAKAVARDPAAFTEAEVREAFQYLMKNSQNGGVLNSRRADVLLANLERQITALADDLERRSLSRLADSINAITRSRT